MRKLLSPLPGKEQHAQLAPLRAAEQPAAAIAAGKFNSARLHMHVHEFACCGCSSHSAQQQQQATHSLCRKALHCTALQWSSCTWHLKTAKVLTHTYTTHHLSPHALPVYHPHTHAVHHLTHATDSCGSTEQVQVYTSYTSTVCMPAGVQHALSGPLGSLTGFSRESRSTCGTCA